MGLLDGEADAVLVALREVVEGGDVPEVENDEGLAVHLDGDVPGGGVVADAWWVAGLGASFAIADEGVHRVAHEAPPTGCGSSSSAQS